MDAKAVIQQIKNENISFIDFWFVDIFGELRSLGMPGYAISEDNFKNGLEKLDASSIRGFKSVNHSDMILKPDASTFRILPSDYDRVERKNARMFCDIYEGNTMEEKRYNRDSRGIAQKASKEVRLEAIERIGNLKIKEAIPTLNVMLNVKELEPQLRKKIEAVLKQLEKSDK